jgi:hypothetical protein
MDLPANSLDLINRFIYNLSFADVSLPNEASYLAEIDLFSSAVTNENGKSWAGKILLLIGIISCGVVLFAAWRWSILKKRSSFPSIQSSNYSYNELVPLSTKKGDDDALSPNNTGSTGMIIDNDFEVFGLCYQTYS